MNKNDDGAVVKYIKQINLIAFIILFVVFVSWMNMNIIYLFGSRLNTLDKVEKT